VNSDVKLLTQTPSSIENVTRISPELSHGNYDENPLRVLISGASIEPLEQLTDDWIQIFSLSANPLSAL
jgi:hypothetical protein